MSKEVQDNGARGGETVHSSDGALLQGGDLDDTFIAQYDHYSESRDAAVESSNEGSNNTSPQNASQSSPTAGTGGNSRGSAKSDPKRTSSKSIILMQPKPRSQLSIDIDSIGLMEQQQNISSTTPQGGDNGIQSSPPSQPSQLSNIEQRRKVTRRRRAQRGEGCPPCRMLMMTLCLNLFGGSFLAGGVIGWLTRGFLFALPFLFVAILCMIPGVYTALFIIRTMLGHRGFSYDRMGTF